MTDFLQGDVKVPVIGKSKKWAVYGIGGAAGVYVGWRWWQARNAAPTGPAPSDGTYSTDLSGMGSAATGGATNVTGNSGNTTTDGTNPAAIDTNGEWTEYAVSRLAQAGYDPATVYAALGAFLGMQTLTPEQATIVRAALATAGQPPIGGPWTVKEQATGGTGTGGGGTTSGTLPAPSGLKVTSVTSSTVSLSWTKVPDAGYYRIYRSGSSTNVGATDGGNTTITIGGLQPNTSYSFQVATDTTTHVPGAKSAAVTGKTSAVAIATPTGIKATSIGTTTINIACNKAAGATRYGWYINGIAHGSSDNPYYLIQGLKPKTSYKVSVCGDNATQGPGKQSAAITVKTK